MRNLRTTLSLGTAALLLSAFPASSAHAAPGDGYVRLAHLSPDTPEVDVYLYSAGKKTPRLVLRHVGYGALSPYQRLGTGSYTVMMRPADAPATSKPVLSTNVRVQSGDSYTVAGMGPYKGIKLDILKDTAELPAGRAGVRVIAASLKQPALDVKVGGRSLADDLQLANATPYRAMDAAPQTVRVQGRKGDVASVRLPLTAGALHTVVVLDGRKGMRLLDLRDARQSAQTPKGGVDTGLGGLAPQTPWWQALAMAALALWFGGRARSQRFGGRARPLGGRARSQP
ncbi:DUF4397 domain-containing protein [Spirillospora sp. NPDC050679]